VGLLKYIKAAFRNHWNLLAFASGVGFSLFSDQPLVGLSLVGAAEIAWLGLIGTHPKFQKYVEAQEHALEQTQKTESAELRMKRMLKSISRTGKDRFRSLKRKCEELRKITHEYQAAHDQSDEGGLSELRLGGLDHLLWLFLKLLYTEQSLNRFFETTSIEEIDKEIRRLEDRLSREQDRETSQQRDRIMATLQDNLQTCQVRRHNFEQARDSYELVKAEQKRLENKIRSLAEMGISRGDPALFSTQVDSVAGSVQETEKTLNDLQFVTGFSEADEAVPEIVRRTVVAR
jgi:hypothetical protein